MTPWYASPFSGLFTHFGPTPTRPHDPAFEVCGGTAASWLGNHQSNTASGIGHDRASAEASCVGEAIERLQAGPIAADQLIESTFRDWPLDEPAVDSAKWVLFHAEQYRAVGFPFEPLTHETCCAWVCLREALSGKPWWIPAELAFLHIPGGHRFCPGYSTGLAAGRVDQPLVLRGLQEVIERDAVVGAWWGRYPIEEHPAATAFALLGGDWGERSERPNLTYRFFRIQTPYSDHSTMVTLEGEDREGFVFSIGSACRETRAASWGKSLLEAIHGRHYVRYLKQQSRAKPGPPTNFAEHAAYYSLYPDERRRTVLAGATPPNVSEAADDSQEGLSQLSARLGPDRPVLFRSMTPPALATERLDWHVMRVVVPGVQPLHGHHAFAHLGGPLWAPRTLADWQAQAPHPFS